MMSNLNTANTSTLELEKIRLLIEDLAQEDATVRMTARASLVDLGHSAIAALVTSLLDPRQHVRWEAAKSLESIADATTAPALVSALHDEDPDVRWVAGAALVAIGVAALPSLLGELIRHSHSVDFSRGAHHVLHDLAKAGHGELLTPVIRALDGPEPGVAAPPMALKVLQVLTFGVAS
jgi:HEAT repeat protein